MHPRPAFEAAVFQRLPDKTAGDIDQNIDPAVRRRYLVERGLRACRIGQVDPASRPDEELGAKPLFEIADMAADRGMSDEQLGCRVCEAFEPSCCVSSRPCRRASCAPRMKPRCSC